MKNPRFSLLLFPLTLLLLLPSCSSETAKKTVTTEGLQPIDIKTPKFFRLIQPWKEGKLVTIESYGRFAEISFKGADKIKITPLVEFPRTQLDRELLTWPEAGLIAGTTGKMHHLAAVDDNKTRSHVPLLTWVHYSYVPVLLDAKEGLVGYCYALQDNYVGTKFFIFNYKEDTITYESPDGFTILPQLAMDNNYILSWERFFNEEEERKESKKIFYNWRTNEIVENDLTKTINQDRVDMLIDPLRNIHPGRRCMFGYSNTIGQKVMVTWDEEYSDVKVTPLSYLAPEGKGLTNFTISTDGLWGSTLVWGYRGLFDEQLCKRAFFHFDGRYPNGISMPIITDDYEVRQREYSAFVEHPVHGLCYAQEWHKNDQLYLRLYKMDDVLAEINRRLLEGAKEVIKK